jgi:hypothetical protein
LFFCLLEEDVDKRVVYAVTLLIPGERDGSSIEEQ